MKPSSSWNLYEKHFESNFPVNSRKCVVPARPSQTSAPPQPKLPAVVVCSPASGSVLVLKLGGWQHDVELNGCPGSYQVLWFQSGPGLGPSAGCV